MPDVFDSLREALAHHQAGRLTDAENIYRSVLAAEPGQAKALYLLGVLCIAAGRLDEAIELLTQATVAAPDDTEAAFNLGNALYRKGDVEAALTHYRTVAERRPGYAEVFANMTRAYQDVARLDDAIAAGQTAIRLKPALAEAHTNLGRAYLAAERLGEAVDAFQAAVIRQPNSAPAQANLANALHRARQHQGAVETARAALVLDDRLAEAWMTQGVALRELGQLDPAVEALRRAVELSPDDAPAHTNLGNALLDQDNHAEADAAFRRAIALDPTLAEAHSGLGYLLSNERRYDEAIASCERAIALRPDFAEAHWNQGFAYLLAGDFARGWEKYEWRKRHPRYAAAYPSFPAPTWEGEDLSGRTLLIHAEQGLGDSIQFIRYAEELAARGARIIVACDKALISLFAPVTGVAQAVDKAGALPAFDLWVDQMSLPRVTRTRLDTIPAPIAYLVADEARVATWRLELGSGVNVGLVWAGNPQHSNDRRRSLPVDAIRPLLDVAGLRFVSLQVGRRGREVEQFASAAVVDLAPRLSDFMETAAVVANLDLVIAVDTAVAHLAGALGKPAWVLLRTRPDWRWLLEREDSPWYPSLRLFRQRHAGDWEDVVGRVRAALARLAPAAR